MSTTVTKRQVRVLVKVRALLGSRHEAAGELIEAISRLLPASAAVASVFIPPNRRRVYVTLILDPALDSPSIRAYLEGAVAGILAALKVAEL